jgi:predicted transcriptional regulator
MMPRALAVGMLLLMTIGPAVSAQRPVSDPDFSIRLADDTKSLRILRAEMRQAVASTPEEFRASWRRPNWHILIQDAPAEARQ